MNKSDYLKLLYHAQLVKHWSDVTDKIKDKYNPSESWMVQYKYDGIYVNLIIDNGVTLALSRTGLPLSDETQAFFTSKVKDLFKEDVLDGVYVLELCNPSLSLEELSGIINPNRKKPLENDLKEVLFNNSYTCFHDFISLKDYKGGMCLTPYLTRYQSLSRRIKCKWVVPSLLVDSSDVQEHANAAIEEGAEGIVIKAPYAVWKAGFRGWHAMKIVREYTMDLRCIGCVFGQGKREGLIAALIFKYKDSTFKADFGKGYTDEERQRLTAEYLENPDSILGIWEIKGLQESSTGKALRLPKVVRPRFDKTIADDEV